LVKSDVWNFGILDVLEIEKELGSPAKKRRGLFEFIQECENIQREGNADTSSAQIKLDNL
jgi:hypothetical protein